MAPSALFAISTAQPAAASSASVRRSTISSARPVSSSTRARKSGPFSAARQASVAISRRRVTPRSESRSAQALSASSVRAMAALDSRLPRPSPSPSLTMREKLSAMRKPPALGRAIRSRQLLVPRSSAA
jgi:hypothetical protein